MTTGEAVSPRDGSPERSPERADDFFAPILFALSAEVRGELARVLATHSGQSGDAEAIHDYRVSLRRLRSLLRPARRLFGKHRIRAIGDDLRRFANSTSALRDEEVLRETLGDLPLPPRARAEVSGWLTQRARRDAQLLNDAVRITLTERADEAEPPLRTVLGRLERRLGTRRGHGVSILAFANEVFTIAVAEAEQRSRTITSAPPALHELRIRFKRVRYLADTLKPVLGERAAIAAKIGTRMQKRLGEIHDLDAALVQIHRTKLSRPTTASLRRALVRARMVATRRVRNDLRDNVIPQLMQLRDQVP